MKAKHFFFIYLLDVTQISHNLQWFCGIAISINNNPESIALQEVPVKESGINSFDQNTVLCLFFIFVQRGRVVFPEIQLAFQQNKSYPPLKNLFTFYFTHTVIMDIYHESVPHSLRDFALCFLLSSFLWQQNSRKCPFGSISYSYGLC